MESDNHKELKKKDNKTVSKKVWIRLFVLLAVFVAISVTLTLTIGSSCLISLVIGFPCPACGMTRANLLALQFDFVGAFNMNPLFFLSAVCLVIVVLITIKPQIAQKKWFTAICFVISIALLGSYVVRMILMFPNSKPMIFNHNSLLGLILKLLGIEI